MATQPSSREMAIVLNQTLYTEDGPIHILGCADQFQLCNQAHTKCTPLTGTDALQDAIKAMQLNAVQNDTAFLLNDAIARQSTYDNINFGASDALRASDTLSTDRSYQVGLPNNQWTIEIAYWFDVSMARLQQRFVSFATGPLYPNKYLEADHVPGPRNVCGRQKIHSTAGYISFSVFGVVIIFSIGGLLILTSLILDSVVGYFRKTYDWNDYKRLQWARDEQLELQRLAYPPDVQAEEDKSSEPEGGNAVSPKAVTLDTSSGTTPETIADTETAPAQTNILAKKNSNRSRFSFNTV